MAWDKHSQTPRVLPPQEAMSWVRVDERDPQPYTELGSGAREKEVREGDGKGRRQGEHYRVMGGFSEKVLEKEKITD